jgi:hypothetical protein
VANELEQRGADFAERQHAVDATGRDRRISYSALMPPTDATIATKS